MYEIRVIAVSRKSTVRQKLRDVLRRGQELRLLGLASDDDAGAKLVKSLQPDVALWDPGDAIQLHRHDPLPAPILFAVERTRVLLVGCAINPRDAIAVTTLGFWGAVSLDQHDDLLICAIRSVSRGELWIERKTLSAAFLALMHVNAVQRHDNSPLSFRENEIATCVAHGLTNKEIAKSLGISDTTVKTHVHRILHKLHLRNRVLLARAEA